MADIFYANHEAWMHAKGVTVQQLDVNCLCISLHLSLTLLCSYRCVYLRVIHQATKSWDFFFPEELAEGVQKPFCLDKVCPKPLSWDNATFRRNLLKNDEGERPLSLSLDILVPQLQVMCCSLSGVVIFMIP